MYRDYTSWTHSRCKKAYLSSHPPAHLKKGQLWASPLGCAGKSSGVSWKLRSLLPVLTSKMFRMSCRVSRGLVGSTLLKVTRYFSPGLNCMYFTYRSRKPPSHIPKQLIKKFQTMLVMVISQWYLSHKSHRLHQIGEALQVTTISASAIAKLSEAAAVRHLRLAFCFFEGQKTASYNAGARMGGTYILMAEPHESLEAGTSPDGHPLPVQGGNICAVRRELYEKLGPAIALVDRLRLASLCVVEKHFGLILVSNDELIPASPIHTPLMQVFLWRKEGISSFLQLVFVRDGRPQACEQSTFAGVCKRVSSPR